MVVPELCIALPSEGAQPSDAEVERIFQAADKSNSGDLQPTEIALAVSMWHSMLKEKAFVDEVGPGSARKVDPRSPLCFWRVCCSRSTCAPTCAAWQVFAKFDTNESHMLELDQIKAFLSELNGGIEVALATINPF